VRVTFAICKNKGRVSVSLICTGLSNAWLECLWWEESYIWCWWDPWHFAQGKASLGNANQPTNGAFFCVFFTFLDLFLPSILPFLTKQDWVRFSFGPLICCTSHSQSQQTQTGSEIMLAKGWHKPREKDHTELITLAADQLLVLVNSKNYSFTNKIFTTIKIVLGFVGPKAWTTKPKAYGRMSWTILPLAHEPIWTGQPTLD